MDTDPFVIFHDFEDTNVGVTRETWPLHCTIAPHFILGETSEREALEVIEAVTNTTAVFCVNEGEEVNYGPRENIPVTTLVDSESRLVKLHYALVSFLGNKGCQFLDSQYRGDKYSPHITHDGRIDLPRLPYVMRSITVGKLLKVKSGKQIVAKYSLGTQPY